MHLLRDQADGRSHFTQLNIRKRYAINEGRPWPWSGVQNIRPQRSSS